MKLKDYLAETGQKQGNFTESLAPEGPTKQAVSRYVTEQDMPSLEVALLIAKATNGKVLPHDLLVNHKRRYTKADDPICVLNNDSVLGDLL